MKPQYLWYISFPRSHSSWVVKGQKSSWKDPLPSSLSAITHSQALDMYWLPVQMHLGHSSIHSSVQTPSLLKQSLHLVTSLLTCPRFPQLPPHRINSWKLLHEQRGPQPPFQSLPSAYVPLQQNWTFNFQYSVQGLHAVVPWLSLCSLPETVFFHLHLCEPKF